MNLIRYSPERKSPPLWGCYVGLADDDLLAMAILVEHRFLLQGLYLAVQATEKYLKALVHSIIDPDGRTFLKPHKNPKWLNTHDLVKLSDYCKTRFPYYGEDDVVTKLGRFSNYDQATRYPFVKDAPTIMSASDISDLEPILWNLRRDLPINFDDYPLGIAVRGTSHLHGTAVPQELTISSQGIESLRRLLPRVDEMVRWPVLPGQD